MNPYVGPRRFEEQDARFFYGREQESRDLLAFVISEPLVLFYAQSGAGKSSLINTSLIPGLRNDNFDVLPVGRVGGNLPDGISEVRNIYTFNLLSNLEPEADPDKFSRMMLTDYLAQAGNGNGQRPSRVLVIDQFEEVVTHHPGRWRDREDFFWQLQAAIHNDPNLWVVLSMREDHFAAVESYAEILPGGLRARFRMERLKLAAAEMAIEKPAAEAGKPFDEGVAREVVKNLSLIRDTENADGRKRYGEYVEPVQLQVVCYQLWENLKNRPMSRITHTHVQALGNVDLALGAFYDTAVQEVIMQSNISEIMLRNWFEKKLITEAHTRGTVYQGPVETEGLANEAVHQLADKYLLRSERRAGAVWYELVHDRFVDPILQANANWLHQKGLLVQAAIAWEQSGRSTSKLYIGEQLKDTLENVDWSNIEPLTIEFLKECGRANQERTEREAFRQRELEQAKKLANEEQKRARAESRNAKILRTLAGGLGILVLFVVFLSILAFINAERASENEETARVAQATAQGASTTIAQHFSDSRNTQATLIAESVNAGATTDALSTIVNVQATVVAEGQGIATTQAILDAQNATAAAATAQSIAQATNSAIIAGNNDVIVFSRFPPNFDQNEGVIYRVDTDGTNERALTSENYSSLHPNWSPDSSRIIFSSNYNNADYELFSMDLDGGQLQQLTENNWNDYAPAWSPNGEWIAFHSNETGVNQIYLMRISSGEIFSLNQAGQFPNWSPDSQTIAFSLTQPHDTARIATININRSGFSGAITYGNDFWPSWSPDGSLIAYNGQLNPPANNMWVTFVCTFRLLCDDTAPLLTSGPNGVPDWSPDGNQIVFYYDAGDGINIWIMDSDGTNLRRVTSSGNNVDTQPKWSP